MNIDDDDDDDIVINHEEDFRNGSNLGLNMEQEIHSPKQSNFSELEFDSDEQAYSFYTRYAELAGFSVRKDWVNRSKVHGRVMSRKFTCSRQGHRKRDKRDVNVKKHRKETRTGCLAHMVVTRQSNGRYRVTQFERDHNHDDVDLAKAQMLLESPISGHGESVEVSETDSLKNSEVQSKLSFQLLGIRFCSPENIDDLEISDDIQLGSARTREMKEGDASRLLYYFQRQHFQNPSFFYAVQLDIDDKVSNIFWADDNMIVEYGHFGDVVCLDTSSTRETDSRPFVQFIGLNHHRQVVIFGAAFLYDDSVNSFKWLFRTFIEAMSGKKPKFILSDQDAIIVQAIQAVLPETSHCICAWQMYLIALKHLHHVIKDYDSFAIDLRSCIFCHEHEEDFIQSWDAMLERHELRQNAWLRWMFREKEKWAVAYGRNTFFIERNGTHLGEQLSTKLRCFLNPDLDALQFFKHFESIVNDQRYRELESTFNMGRHAPVLMANAVLLKEPSLIYTPKAFDVFQREYEKCLNVVVEKFGERDARFDFRAKTYGKSKDFLVIYNSLDGTVSCNCMKYEHVGILCCHALKVLDHQNIKIVPSYYILNRWTKDARIPSIQEHHDYPVDYNRKIIASRYKDLCRNIIKISARAAESDPAFEFAARQLDEVMQGVERILNFKSGDENRVTCASDNDLAENDFESQDVDILKGTSGTESIVRDKEQITQPKTIISVACAPSTYISSPNATLSPLAQGLYTVDANLMVQSMYQASNISSSQEPNHNIYDQFLQESLVRNAFQDPMSNVTQLKQVMDDDQNPHSSSFIHYNHRYRAPDV